MNEGLHDVQKKIAKTVDFGCLKITQIPNVYHLIYLIVFNSM